MLFIKCNPQFGEEIFFRTNQVGFLPTDIKTAVILSKKNLSDQSFSIINLGSKNVVLENEISDTLIAYGNFKYCYQIDFSSVTSLGEYIIKIADNESYPFKIGEKIFNPVRDSLSLFFKVQRCGPTNPLLHQPCHLSDAYKLIGYKDSSAKDLTGGWHDAGDYVKFLRTTAYTTYLLLFSYDFDNQKFSYDLDRNNVPDILEEAKVGIDWLLRSNINDETLVVQVQDENDHSVSWRLPENDSLQFVRPAYVNLAKNTIGFYSATLALASKIWKEKFYDDESANKWLEVAEKFYSKRNYVSDLDSTFSDIYPDNDFNGKLALAAIELYNITQKENYLRDAIEYGNNARADFWWGIGQINSLAHFKIAKYKPEFSKYIHQNLISALKYSRTKTFNEALNYSWGSTNTFMGIALQSILYKNLTASTEFDSLIILQRDYILGRNPWGKSFIYNIGLYAVKNLHSQVAFFNKGYLPGGLSAGPAPTSTLKNYSIKRNKSSLMDFNSGEVEYFDDVSDFICNEPTISSNATALFVFGYFSN